jgi:multidrug efflux pump subunit AcrA (membrane-fusion protein)
VVILVDHLDRVSDAVGIARRTRTIALQSIFVGMSLSGVAMAAAAFGWLSPVAGALTQEAIDVAVILNALRALKPGHGVSQPAMSAKVVSELHEGHQRLETSLDRLRQIADSLDDATPKTAVESIAEANRIVATEIIAHERVDENSIYPRLSRVLSDRYGLYAMSRAHREILHLGKLLARLSDGLQPKGADRYLIRDAQRIVESIDSLVRIHNAQEEEIYESALSNGSENQAPIRTKKLGAGEGGEAVGRKRRWIVAAAAGLLALMAIGGDWFYRSQRHMSAPHYLTQKVDRGSVGRAIIVNGVIGAGDRKSVNALVTGVIQALDCDVGAKVTAGQLCANIDPRPYKVAVDLAETNLAVARARVEKDRDRPARKRAKRGEALISKRQSELRAAEIALEHTNVLAPIDGTVIVRNVELGQRITADEINPPLFIISENLAIARIEAQLDQRDFHGVKVGDPASIVPELTPPRSIAGVVSELRQSPVSGKNEAVYNLVVGAPNTNLLLAPAMKATIRLVADRHDDVLRVTGGALRYAIAKATDPSGADYRENQKDGSSRVWILRDARPTPISLRLGLNDGDYTEVVGGEIQLGDELIVGQTSDALTKTTEPRAPKTP